MKTYETTLPSNYTTAKVIDANDKKLGAIFNIIALLPALLSAIITAIIVQPSIEQISANPSRVLLTCVLFVVIMLVGVVVHELLHGLAYKLLTKQKLTFGLTLTVAFCGVPNIFVYRRTALVSLLAPFVCLLPVYVLLLVFAPDPLTKILCAYLLGMHVGGCVGDLYDTILLLFKYKNPLTLIQDTGPVQTFYIPQE